MKIALGSDHAGFRYKEKVKELLQSLGHEVKDCGTYDEIRSIIRSLFVPAAETVARGECDRGDRLWRIGKWRGDGGQQGEGDPLRTLLE